MPRESNLEMKVGIFVVAAIVCLVAFVFSISDFSVFKKGDSYRVMFTYAGGLKKGAPVRLAGVDAGYVKEIKILHNDSTREAAQRTLTPVAKSTSVVVDVWMEKGFVVPVDSNFLINQLGLLGEKYLEVIPGISTDIMTPGTIVHGEDPVSMEDVMKMVGSIGGKLETTLANVNQGVLTEQNKVSLAATLANMASITEGVKTGVLSETNKASLAAVLANVAAISEGIKKGDGTVGKFLTDPVVFKNLDELTADLKANPWKLLYRPKK
ncbi:MAG: MCE family protein [Candidatus Omnitrophica bacterium]|nr:MCE family protein [Candidatus Omnitrophota bacterium]